MKATLKNKKGFTLVEIIVVLVIIAILAAVAVPSMIGFVGDARGKAFVTEAKVGMSAAQAVVTEIVASGAGTVNAAGVITWATARPTAPPDIMSHPAFMNMTSDVENAGGAGTNGFSAPVIDVATSRVTGITYTSSNGTVVLIDNGTVIINP